jgi:hypothetical protein
MYCMMCGVPWRDVCAYLYSIVGFGWSPTIRLRTTRATILYCSVEIPVELNS